MTPPHDGPSWETEGEKNARLLEEWEEEHPWEFAIDSMRVILNYMFIAAPWAILGGSALGWNIVLNAIFN